MMLSNMMVAIIAGSAMLVLTAPTGYKLPSLMHDPTAVRTPEMYLLAAFLGWSFGLLFGVFIGDLLGSTFFLVSSVAGGFGGLAGTTLGIAVRGIVNHVRRQRTAKK